LIVAKTKDYEVIDAGNGLKKERWANYIFLRPDPNCMWNSNIDEKDCDSIYYRKENKSGFWKNINNVPSRFTISYNDLKFYVYQMGFKHTGIFPEQVVNWDFEQEKIINSKRKIKVLNLFAYTGCSTCVMMNSGAHVTHVDASKSAIGFAKDNIKLNKLDEKNVRFICEDVINFVKREIRRGNKYDAIVMDPPSYGIGANHEVWSIKDNLCELVNLCKQLLSDNPLFFIISSYSGDITKPILLNILNTELKDKFNDFLVDDVVFETSNNLYLPCGIIARTSNK